MKVELLATAEHFLIWRIVATALTLDGVARPPINRPAYQINSFVLNRFGFFAHPGKIDNYARHYFDVI